MATNDFLPFGTGTEDADQIMPQANYALDIRRQAGNPQGIASRSLNNKALRQSSTIAAAVAQAISDLSGDDMLDDGDVAAKVTSIKEVISPNPDTLTDATLDGTERIALKQSGSWLRTTVQAISAFVTGIYTLTLHAGVGGVARTLLDILRDLPVNAKNFGAKGDGSNSTSAIQAALNVSKNVCIPPGRHLLSATLHGRPNTTIFGSNAETTIFVRDGMDYGHTLECGTEEAGNLNNANSFSVRGIWFLREFEYAAGITASIPDPLSSTTAHIKINGGQRAIVEDCMVWGTPILIDVVSSSLVTIRRNGLRSMIWDNRISGLREGVAAIQLRNSSVMSGHTQLVTLHDNHINGGYFSVSRPVTTGTVTEDMVECVGALYGVKVEACEGLNIYDNYLGAFNQNNLYFNPTGIVTNVKVWGNFIDGSRDYAITFNAENGNPSVGVQIFGNDFNMQLINYGAVNAITQTWPTVTKLKVFGNNIENSIMTPILLFSARGASITDNSISAYNVRRGGDDDPLYASGLYVGGSSTKVFASNNNYGGDVNTLDPSANGCKWGVYYDGTGKGFAAGEKDFGRALGVGTPLVVGGDACATSPNQVAAALAGNYQMVPSDNIYIRNYAAAVPNLVNLPASPIVGQEHTVKDGTGTAGTQLIIVGTPDGKTIDGAASIDITTNYGFMKFRFNGTQWNRIG